MFLKVHAPKSVVYCFRIIQIVLLSVWNSLWWLFRLMFWVAFGFKVVLHPTLIGGQCWLVEPIDSELFLCKEVWLGNAPRIGRNTNMNHDFTFFLQPSTPWHDNPWNPFIGSLGSWKHKSPGARQIILNRFKLVHCQLLPETNSSHLKKKTTGKRRNIDSNQQFLGSMFSFREGTAATSTKIPTNASTRFHLPKTSTFASTYQRIKCNDIWNQPQIKQKENLIMTLGFEVALPRMQSKATKGWHA